MSLFAILSDTHDQIANLNTAVGYANEAKADILIHCGDLISSFMLHRLANFLGPVHLIYGNNVGDTHLIIPRCYKQFPEITHHGVYGSFVEGGLSIAMVHYPEFARKLASTGIYDVVCCGHTHQYLVEKIGKTLVINPGSMMGEHNDAGFVLLDTQKWSIQRIGIGDCMFDRPVPVRGQQEHSLTGKKDRVPIIPNQKKHDRIKQ